MDWKKSPSQLRNYDKFCHYMSLSGDRNASQDQQIQIPDYVHPKPLISRSP